MNAFAAAPLLPTIGISDWFPAWPSACERPSYPSMSVVAESVAEPADEEAALIAAAQGGDGRAFAELVRCHAGRVSRLVARFARSRSDLEEISQDVFIDVHRSLGRYDGRAPFEHWVCRIATRRCHDHLRRLYRRRWLGSLEVLLASGREPVAPAPAVAAAENPRVEALRAALQRLPPDQQTVITLLELEEHSVRETAALTGWSEGNVKVRAHRAREALRRALAITDPADFD